jgi:hypothetical protein
LGRSFHQTHQCEHSVLVTPSLQSNSDTCIPNHQIITLLYNVYLFICWSLNMSIKIQLNDHQCNDAWLRDSLTTENLG